MDLQQFQQLLLEKQQEIEQALRRTLPVKVGRIAKDHFQEGFLQGGFQDNGTQPWQRKKRPDKYGPLMSSRQNLYGSIYYHPDDYRVTVGTSVPYAEIHNEGGDIIVTPRMKRFFWAKTEKPCDMDFCEPKRNIGPVAAGKPILPTIIHFR